MDSSLTERIAAERTFPRTARAPFRIPVPPFRNEPQMNVLIYAHAIIC
jgi:hypothetical protein